MTNMHLKQLAQNSIIFTEKFDASLVNDITTCLTNTPDNCNSKNPVCMLSESNQCQLVIPKYNLLTPTINNELFYFKKMADELIRYSRIKTFIFNPQQYLSFGNLNYKFNENEIIIIQSLLTKDYFDGLVPEISNKYVKHNAFDNVGPIITQPYANLLNDEKHTGCNPEKINISSKIWKKCFPPTYKELYYKGDIECGYAMIIDIIFHYKGIKMEISEIKKVLIDQYLIYWKTHSSSIINILILEGKKTEGNKVKQNLSLFKNFIYADDYFITNLDLWILMNYYEIPSIILSSKPILLTKKLKNELVLHGSNSDSCCFIISPSLRAENVPKYSLIFVSNEEGDEIFHSLDIILNEDCSDKIKEAFTLKQDIQTYLTHYEKPKLKLKFADKELSPLKPETEEEEEEEEEKVIKKKKIVKKVESEEEAEEEVIKKKKIVKKVESEEDEEEEEEEEKKKKKIEKKESEEAEEEEKKKKKIEKKVEAEETEEEEAEEIKKIPKKKATQKQKGFVEVSKKKTKKRKLKLVEDKPLIPVDNFLAVI